MTAYLKTVGAWVAMAVLGLGEAYGLQLASPFTDSMVLQQGQAVPVWGTGVTGENVTVQFSGQKQSVAVGADGNWKLALNALKASSDPADFVVTAMNTTGAVQTLTLTNVVVGEVWICSGQSNMQWPLSLATNAEGELNAADYPAIRMFNVKQVTAAAPVARCEGRWVVSSRATAGSFSAVGYFFARRLHRELNVPVGMLNTSWGGSPVEPWTSLDGLRTTVASNRVAAFEAALADYTANRAQYDARRAEAIRSRDRALAAWEASNVTNDVGQKERWFAGVDGSGVWNETMMPMPNKASFLSNYMGSVWCRVSIDVPPAWVGRDLSLNIGAVDEMDTTYVNGKVVGQTRDTTKWTEPRHYTVPGAVVTGTTVSIVIRVDNQLGEVGILGQARDYHIEPVKPQPGEAPVSLSCPWQYALGTRVEPRSRPNPQVPSIPGSGWDVSTIYNAMIAPLVPYAMQGAIWYQGESNAGQPEQYAELFPAMIASWRKAWERPAFPFLFVQLANFMARQKSPVETNSWADVRDSQKKTLAVPQTGMAVAIDIGVANDIHPRNKQDVGSRLALWALANTYGRKDLVYSGPLYRAMTVAGNRVTLTFDHVGGGLVARGEPLVGFAVAGEDKVFHAATASIEGKTVVVWSDKVSAPVAVRYAWANNPICNLFNAEGLPASPFRSDAWSRTEVLVGDETLAEPSVR